MSTEMDHDVLDSEEDEDFVLGDEESSYSSSSELEISDEENQERHGVEFVLKEFVH